MGCSMLCPFWHTEKREEALDPIPKCNQVVECFTLELVKGRGKQRFSTTIRIVFQSPDPLYDLQVLKPVQDSVKVSPGHRNLIELLNQVANVLL